MDTFRHYMLVRYGNSTNAVLDKYFIRSKCLGALLKDWPTLWHVLVGQWSCCVCFVLGYDAKLA